MNTWFAIQWAHPENSIYFVLCALMLFLALYRLIRTNTLITILGKTVSGHKFLRNTSYTRIIIKNVLWGLAICIIFVTLLHPYWNTKEETVIQEGRDLFIALDISASMLAQDVKPNRLTFAKHKITDLIHALPSDRIGLLLFSGSSFVQCPLTRDHTAFLMYLNQVDVDTIASGGTALDQTIAQALDTFKHSGSKKNKLLVIFTDGEDFSSNLASYKHEAHQQGMTIFTIGIGTEQGAPIPLLDHLGKQSGHLKDRNGTVVISKLHEEILGNLANELGGTYVHAAPNAHDISELVTQIEKREKELVEERTMAQPDEQYSWFLLVSFILLVLEWLL